MTDQLMPLNWDSEFLGYPVGRISIGSAAWLPELVVQARAAGYRLLYLVAPPDNPAARQAAQQQGAVLVDRKVTYVQPVVPAALAGAEPDIVEVMQLSPALRALALQSGAYSRFRLDANFGPQVYEQLYTRWLENSLAGQMARVVLAYCPAGQPARALLTLGVKQARADIGLLAVDAASRGAGLGQRMVAAARQRAAAWGLPELQVVTQLDNKPACGFYEKCGFRPERVEHIYHLWLR